MARWRSWLSRMPVTHEDTSSSLVRVAIWRVGQEVKTLALQAGITSSSLVPATRKLLVV